MATFIPHNHLSSADNADIAIADTFYPALRLSDFREKMRVDDTVTSARIAEQMTMAMLMITHDISHWRHRQSAHTLGTDKVNSYRMAVFNRTKALIIENYRDIDTTKEGHAKATAMENAIDTYLQRSREMQRQLIACSRTTIKLV